MNVSTYENVSVSSTNAIKISHSVRLHLFGSWEIFNKALHISQPLYIQKRLQGQRFQADSMTHMLRNPSPVSA